MGHPLLSRIEEQLWPNGRGRDIWMIVDAARDRQIFGMLLNSYFEYSCLYGGPIPSELEVAAPYLVQLEYEDGYSRRLLENAWGKSWGILLKCNLGLEAVRRHLRGFLIVRGPRGNRLLFRYYDPRVLRAYLPTCLPDELQTVFGPIEGFWTEGETEETMLQFQVQRSKLVTKAVSLVGDEKAAESSRLRSTA
ncbi:MAG TPA: DUF4123 domain-containing protein [Terriglobales bacterium]|nr:DUF4123 domain-containing protein [Terriglobales bacterium]